MRQKTHQPFKCVMGLSWQRGLSQQHGLSGQHGAVLATWAVPATRAVPATWAGPAPSAPSRATTQLGAWQRFQATGFWVLMIHLQGKPLLPYSQLWWTEMLFRKHPPTPDAFVALLPAGPYGLFWPTDCEWTRCRQRPSRCFHNLADLSHPGGPPSKNTAWLVVAPSAWPPQLTHSGETWIQLLVWS